MQTEKALFTQGSFRKSIREWERRQSNGPNNYPKWFLRTMLATIDQGGRVVVPKDVRERLGLVPGTSVELTEVDGHLEVAPAVTPMRLEDRDGALILATDVAMPVMTTDTVRAVIEATRR